MRRQRAAKAPRGRNFNAGRQAATPVRVLCPSITGLFLHPRPVVPARAPSARGTARTADSDWSARTSANRPRSTLADRLHAALAHADCCARSWAYARATLRPAAARDRDRRGDTAQPRLPVHHPEPVAQRAEARHAPDSLMDGEVLDERESCRSVKNAPSPAVPPPCPTGSSSDKLLHLLFLVLDLLLRRCQCAAF